MDGILPTTAHLLGVILETLFYGKRYRSSVAADGLKNGTGIYIVVFGVSMYYLVRPNTRKHGISGSRRSPNKAVVAGGLLLFSTITAVSLVQL